jgi:hypothetical protein
MAADVMASLTVASTADAMASRAPPCIRHAGKHQGADKRSRYKRGANMRDFRHLPAHVY